MFSAKKAIPIFLLLAMCFPGVMAIQYASFAEPDTEIHKDVYLYYANGTLQGMYNTTSSLISLPNDTDGDFMFVIKPQYTSPLDDPGDFLTGLIGWLQTNILSLLILAAMAGFLFRKW